MPDIDSRNHFYLGRDHDLATGENAASPLLYKSKDLTTHAVCVGMTGSGKTGLCVSLLEEAALDGVPAICIDPKGDLGNLLLGFPELRPADFRPWIDESVAERKGKTPDDYAADTAELWRKGLGSWDQGPERIQKYNDSVERVIFTPGATHGIPMTVLKSFDAPPDELRQDVDAFRQRVSSAVSGLLALLDIDADPVRSREHIFLSNVLTTAWNEGRDLGIAQMIREIQEPPFKTVGVMDLDTFYPKKDRAKLAMELNNLLASPSFAGWMTGQSLDVGRLFYSEEGKPRLSIVSIAHLSDAERMFFVTILLNEVLAWMRTQPGTGSLRCLLYMDEVFGYFPPSKNPPSKEPMLTLLKQARAFGLGCVLATQNPVDLDYKGLSNAGTWFLGRLQTERDKMRVMEGLEGASAQAGSTFDKQAMERTLAGVGSRVFLMNNVHEDQPRVFHTRWAMSYLAGPLSRGAIKKLMDPLRERFPIATPSDDTQEQQQEKKESSEETSAQQEAEVEKVEQKPKPQLTPAQGKKLAAAEQKMSEYRDALVKGILLLPLLPIQIVWAIFQWLSAKQQETATTRKQNAIGTAGKQAAGELRRLVKTHTAWRSAVRKRQDLLVSIDGRPKQRTPLLPVTAWLLLVFYLILIVVIAVVGASMIQGQSPSDSQASESLQSRESGEPAPDRDIDDQESTPGVDEADGVTSKAGQDSSLE